MKDIYEGRAEWSKLFEEVNFFTRYKHFICELLFFCVCTDICHSPFIELQLIMNTRLRCLLQGAPKLFAGCADAPLEPYFKSFLVFHVVFFETCLLLDGYGTRKFGNPVSLSKDHPDTIKKFKELGTISHSLGRGRKITAVIPSVIKKVHSRIRRSPRPSIRKIAKDIGISILRCEEWSERSCGFVIEQFTCSRRK